MQVLFPFSHGLGYLPKGTAVSPVITPASGVTLGRVLITLVLFPSRESSENALVSLGGSKSPALRHNVSPELVHGLCTLHSAQGGLMKPWVPLHVTRPGWGLEIGILTSILTSPLRLVSSTGFTPDLGLDGGQRRSSRSACLHPVGLLPLLPWGGSLVPGPGSSLRPPHPCPWLQFTFCPGPK